MGSRRSLLIGPAVLWLTATAGFGQPLPQNGARQEDQASKLYSLDPDALSNTQVTTASKFSEAGMDGYVTKPICGDLLLQTLEDFEGAPEPGAVLGGGPTQR